MPENVPENKNNESLSNNSPIFYWHKIILASILILFIVTNIALLKRYQYEKKMRIDLHEKYSKVREMREKIGLQQATNWQAELQVQPILEKGIVLFSQQKYDEALEKLNIVADSGLEIPIAYFLRAQVFYELKQDENCIQDITKYHDSMPSSHYALFIRAKSYYRLGQTDKATDDLKQAIAQTDNFAEAEEFIKKIER